MKHIKLTVFLLTLIILGACSSEPQTIEVTKEVTRVIEVTSPPVEVTKIVEVTSPPVEVTRIVEVPVEVTVEVPVEVPVDDEETDPAPVPDAVWGPQIDFEKGYFVEELGDGLYWVTEGAYQIMFLTTGEGVIVVDAPPTIGQNILNAITEVTDEPITHIIYSHTHADHIGAAGIFPPEAEVIAQTETALQLESALSPDREFPYGIYSGGGPVPLPTITFDDEYTLEVGNQVLELSYKGPAHEPGNIFIYAPEQKVLMLVDVIFPAWTPFAELALAEDIIAYYDAHPLVLDYEFDYFIGGHLTRLGTREDVEMQWEYLLDIRTNAQTALQTVDFAAIGQEVGFENPWALFDVYLDEIAQQCTEATEEKWLGVLGAVDIFTYGHCWVVVESIRID